MEALIPITRSASLCPIRPAGSGIEVLLARRAFWNERGCRPMRYPGEWMFAGGGWEEGDLSLCETAIREFREELGYEGNIIDPRFLRRDAQEAYGKTHYVEFYASALDHPCSFRPQEQEIIDHQWIAPNVALDLMLSTAFSRSQEREFLQRGLNYSCYGRYQHTNRAYPLQNILTLALLQSRQEEFRHVYARL